ncbi:hypothetical protein ACFGVR_06115 [Mucilaginibacter sp. AW1-3]
MKKIFAISAVLLTAVLSAKAQKEVLFKMKTLPDHQYSLNMKMNMDMNMEGAPQGANGAPQKMQMEMGMKMEMKTGRVNSKKEFPISMDMEMSPSTMTVNGKTTPIPNAAVNAMPTMYGKCTLDGWPHIDSISGKTMTDSMKTAMNTMMEGFQSQLKFPDKPMKIGETFVQNMPFNIPIMGAGMKSDLKVTYKLISISGGKANFDTNYTMDIDMAANKSMPAAMHMTGGGNGTMEYDIAVNYPTHYIQNMDMNMTMPAGGKDMTMKMKMKMDMQTVVK